MNTVSPDASSAASDYSNYHLKIRGITYRGGMRAVLELFLDAPEKTYTVREVARILNKSEQTTYALLFRLCQHDLLRRWDDLVLGGPGRSPKRYAVHENLKDTDIELEPILS